MARVEWTRIEPGDIEQVVAILLCRENPAAVRVRPSRGDGGIRVRTEARYEGMLAAARDGDVGTVVDQGPGQVAMTVAR